MPLTILLIYMRHATDRWLDGVIIKKNGDDEDFIEEDDLDDDPDDSIVKTEGTGKTNINKKKEKNATLSQLFHMSRNDWPLLVIAFLSLIIAAIGQAFIPKLTGNIINSVAHFQDLKMLENASLELILAAVITAIFTAIRGSVFTLAMARLNMRVRIELFVSLLQQELAFFDVTKTGKITSRLNADTTKMSDQISLNLNVFLRSVVQAILVLIFMFRINLQLSFVTFISVPIIVFISKVYGQYWRKLTKSTQKKLAEANGVSDAAVSSMSTVKYFASELSEEERYTKKLELFYTVNARSATIYAVYAMVYTALPALATALVLFYGGKLVLEKKMRPGDLVSFMLYQQSLSSAFNTIGSIYSGLAGALGAADKVFELINRKSTISSAGNYEPNKTVFRGNIEFRNVSFRYPTRKENIVLRNFNLKIKSGDVVALVGTYTFTNVYSRNATFILYN
jgi:ATP-binding cassette, subfamily B (MDR/TAP), member 9